MELDHLDKIAAEGFDGYIVRKDLVRKFARQYPVPTYVCEFLLGRYCASVNEEEIQEGLSIVERQLRDRAVRSGEEELFKARARETGTVKIIDIISARLDAKTDCLSGDTAQPATEGCEHSRQAGPRQRADADGRVLCGDRPDLRCRRLPRRRMAGRSRIAALRPIQLSKRDVLDDLYSGRKRFSDGRLETISCCAAWAWSPTR